MLSSVVHLKWKEHYVQLRKVLLNLQTFSPLFRQFFSLLGQNPLACLLLPIYQDLAEIFLYHTMATCRMEQIRNDCHMGHEGSHNNCVDCSYIKTQTWI